MKAATSREIERGRGAAEPREGDRRAGERFVNPRIGLLIGVAVLAICVALDVWLDREAAAIVGSFVAAPFITALVAGPVATGLIGLAAITAAIASPSWNMNTETPEQLVQIGVIALGTVFAVIAAWVRQNSLARSDRLRLLDSVGAVADGSLPLAETLREVTKVISPAVADICMIDAVHEGRVTRLTARARGRDDWQRIEEGIRRREPSLPKWLVDVERPWRSIPRWLPRMKDEDLRRMAHDEDDLAFLRSIGVGSSISAPIRARDRNLGVLTLIAAWSKRRYSSDDVRFAQILSSRIGLALDNAGLFSDLESIERRMDTVMSILDEAVVIHGSDGELVFANPAAARTLGYETSEEAVSTPSARLSERFSIRDESGKEVGAESLAGHRAPTGAPAEPLTLRIVSRATGAERWMRSKGRAIDGPSGEALYSVSAIEDVTEVKRAEFAHRLFARTGELLSDVVDYRLTMERVPQLLVPDFADWCSVEMPGEDGDLERVSMAHRDRERSLALRELRRRHPIRLEDSTRIGAAIRDGEAQLFEMTDERLRELAIDPDHLEALRALEIGSVIIAPMSVGREVVGALVFINHLGSRVFDQDDREVAVEVARRVALAIEVARVADERARVADALQRELLPPSLPRMPGWQMATMYEPAGEINEVGGDFYEVFKVEGAWAVVLGDVSGKGAAAAALTAEARHTIRTAGSLSGDPCRGLYVLDENLRGRDDAALCSVAVLVLPEQSSAELEVEVFLAGHPHPLLLRDGRAELIGEPGPLLGVVDDPGWSGSTAVIRPGEQLILYTDGVIEARRESGERFGTERLQEGLAGCETPELAVERVRSALAHFGARPREDDAALVAIRRGAAGTPVATAPARETVSAG